MQEQHLEENLSQDPKVNLQELIESEEFQRMYAKMHTPWVRRHKKVGRNEICPFCNSGKKYKNCECSKNAEEIPEYTLNS